MNEVVKLASSFPFAATIQKLRSMLEEANFRIFAVVDQREAARSVGLDMSPTTLLVYGNPKGGTHLMIEVPDIGIDLPLKLLVREENEGKVFVVYTPARSLERRHGLAPGSAAGLASAEPLIAAAVGSRPD